MSSGEEMEDRNVLSVKRGMVAPSHAGREARIDSNFSSGAGDYVGELLGRLGSEDGYPVIPHPSDHIEVDHGRGRREGKRGMGHVMTGAVYAKLFSRKGHKNDRSRGARGQATQPFNQVKKDGCSRGVVIRSVMHLSLRARVPRAKVTQPYMVVMGADDNIFLFEFRIGAWKNGDHVVAPLRYFLQRYVD